LDEAAPGVVKLRLDELAGACREARTIARALVDEERRQLRGNLLNDSRIRAGVTHAKHIALQDLDADVVLHSLDDVFHDAAPAQLGVEIEVRDDALEPRAAHRLLPHRA